MDQPSSTELQQKFENELMPLSIIRTETALSRFPIHRLVKKGDVQIEIKNQVAALLWEVTYNSKYGQPGPLAYKLDTLIVNRRIEEAGRPVPEVIRLGSLRDICRELGNTEGGEASLSVKRALQQNASAFINAKISYRTIDRAERLLEASFTRYSVILTGEKLPDGRSADAVYLILNRPYIEVLNGALSRPLDYDYMRALPPAAQRFYEIVSYQVYAAFHFKNERARLRYSEYCLLSTATRYPDFDRVKKQMYKVHRPHLESGYLGKVTYEATVDEEGNPDWWMCYIPGPNAAREYKSFTGGGQKVGRSPGKRKVFPPEDSGSLLLPLPELIEPDSSSNRISLEPVEQLEASDTPAMPTFRSTPSSLEIDSETKTLIASLIAAELNRSDAERLAREKPEECHRQLEFLPYVKEFKTSKGAYLRRAIEQGFAAPATYRKDQMAKQARQKQQEEKEAKQALEAAEEARRRAETEEIGLEIARLEKEAPKAFMAFLGYVENERQQQEKRLSIMPASISDRMRRNFESAEKRVELYLEWKRTNHIV